MAGSTFQKASSAVAAVLGGRTGRLPRPGVLLPLLALGLALRLRQYVACPSYWYDEAYLLVNIFQRSCLELLGPLREDQAAPPLFLWLLRGLYLTAGTSEWWMRLPALGASVAGLLVLVPLARAVAGRRAWPWVVAFCALGHHAAAHAGEVKPYALDFLMTELILLAALRCLKTAPTLRARLGFCLLALAAPWVSYPSVFILAAACLALLVHAVQSRQVPSALFGALATGALVLSGLLLWTAAARHQATAGLNEFWASSFLDLSSPGAALTWTVRYLIEAGNYGTREMGLPLLALAVIGAAGLGRRAPAHAVLLAGPFALALLASALHRYPLGGRLLFFLVPCSWLLAARGIGVMAGRLRLLPPRLVRALPALLLIPAALWTGRHLVQVTPRGQFREAFAYVERQRAAGDEVWVSHPQVYEVYHGRPPLLSAYSRPEAVARAAQTGRLWMVCAVAGAHERPTAPAMVAQVSCMGVPRLCQRFRGVQVTLYTPDGGSSFDRHQEPFAP
jgi:hypothetical protein